MSGLGAFSQVLCTRVSMYMSGNEVHMYCMRIRHFKGPLFTPQLTFQYHICTAYDNHFCTTYIILLRVNPVIEKGLISFCDSLRALDYSLENGGGGFFYTLLMVAPVGLLEVGMGRIPWRTMRHRAVTVSLSLVSRRYTVPVGGLRQ